ncbi:MAG: hypothetical protein OXC93_11410 [Rhodospirillaceae bacterium]|nr:hypothetical protein [Rhodospirillaceae bacterium]
MMSGRSTDHIKGQQSLYPLTRRPDDTFTAVSHVFMAVSRKTHTPFLEFCPVSLPRLLGPHGRRARLAIRVLLRRFSQSLLMGRSKTGFGTMRSMRLFLSRKWHEAL